MRHTSPSPSRTPSLTSVSLFLAIIFLFADGVGATITQGDLSIFGGLSSRWSGRFGEGNFGKIATQGVSRKGGPYEFTRWDLVQARQIVDIRPDYQIIKNYSLLGRFDTLIFQDADVFALYRGWYDAFPDFKPKGTAPAGFDYPKYTHREKIAKFVRNDLREYYAQLNINDDFSFRVGKQQIIWTEADALSGTEVINPPDLRYHFIHFESPEDQRRNIRMVKMNYALKEIWKTTNNELEAFWIPGDWQGHPSFLLNTSDSRDPYALTFANRMRASIPNTNQAGFPSAGATFHETEYSPALEVPAGSGAFFDYRTWFRNYYNPAIFASQTPTNSIKNSEFGARYSTMVPVGNGLQISLIYMYLARAAKTGVDPFGLPPDCLKGPNPTCQRIIGPDLPPSALNLGPGIWGTVNTTACNTYFPQHPNGLKMTSLLGGPNCPIFTPPARVGQLKIGLASWYRRTHYMGLTGTYYDKDLTDIVYRYDFGYKANIGIFQGNNPKGLDLRAGRDQGLWTDQFSGIIAFDRPTFIPWLSKQHTFIVAQWTTNWYPSAHDKDIQSIVSGQGKLRHYQNFVFVAAVNWLLDARWVTTNVFLWDIDTRAGFIGSTNVFRINPDLLASLNLQWYQGASGRWTDPITMSRDQRINEVEFRLTYEI